MRLFNLLVVLVLSVGLVSAVSVCIDLDAPSVPSNLSVSGKVGSILLEWGAAVDEPDCSGIGEYVVSRDGDWIGTVAGDVLSFVDNESLGTGGYVYSVYAVDLVGSNSGPAVVNKVVLIKPDNGVPYIGGGGGSSSSRCYESWVCGNWSECVGGEQRRLCGDLQKCGTIKDRPEIYGECGEGGGLDDEMVVTGADVDGGVTGFFSRITGGVVGVVGSTGGIVVSVFVLVILGGFVAIRVRKKRMAS